MAKDFLDKIIDLIFPDKDFNNNIVGKYGEHLTERELKFVRLFGRKGKILRNIYVPKDNGETSEIDVVYITQKGIFVIESKNYSGWIFGDEQSAYWTMSLPNRQKNRFYNPIKQNKTHIKWLISYLDPLNYTNIPMFSFIVFSERCELKKISLVSDNIKVIQRDRLYANIRDVWDKQSDVISETTVDTLYNLLKQLTNVDEAVKQAHINDINKKYRRDKIVEPESNLNNNVLICPKCGSNLVLRTAKKGENAGRQFYGCSNFPKCRYIQNL